MGTLLFRFQIWDVLLHCEPLRRQFLCLWIELSLQINAQISKPFWIGTKSCPASLYIAGKLKIPHMTAANPQKTMFLERCLVSLKLFHCPKASVQTGFCELPQEYAILMLLDLHKLLCDSSSLCTTLSALLTMLLQLTGLEKGKLPFYLCLIALFPFMSGNYIMKSLYIKKMWKQAQIEAQPVHDWHLEMFWG